MTISIKLWATETLRDGTTQDHYCDVELDDNVELRDFVIALVGERHQLTKEAATMLTNTQEVELFAGDIKTLLGSSLFVSLPTPPEEYSKYTEAKVYRPGGPNTARIAVRIAAEFPCADSAKMRVIDIAKVIDRRLDIMLACDWAQRLLGCGEKMMIRVRWD